MHIITTYVNKLNIENEMKKTIGLHLEFRVKTPFSDSSNPKSCYLHLHVYYMYSFKRPNITISLEKLIQYWTFFDHSLLCNLSISS